MEKVDWLRNVLSGSLILILAACGQVTTSTLPDHTSPPITEADQISVIPTGTPSPGEENSNMTPTMPKPESTAMQNLIEKAKDDLALRLSIETTQIGLLEAKAVVWPDASLGCPQPGLIHAQVQTAGYLIQLGAKSKSYEYHTDANQQVVLCEMDGVSTLMSRSTPSILREETIMTPVSGKLASLISRAKEDLARRLEITPDEIEVLYIEKAEWPDTSLGCAEPGLARRPVAISGYRIILETKGREYVYHTDRESGVAYCPKG